MKRVGVLIWLVIIGILAGLSVSWFSLHQNPSAASTQPLMAGCSTRTSDQHLVRKTLGGYLNAWQLEKPEDMYVYLSAQDKARITKQDYVTQFGQFPVKPLKYYIKKVTFSEPQSATVTLQVSWPNVDGDAVIAKEESFVLVKEGADWKIREDISLVN